MKTIFENVIRKGDYDLTDMLNKIDVYHIEGKLTDEERDELYEMARQEPKAKYNVAMEIEKLWAAIRELQNIGADSDEYPEFVQPTGAHDAYNSRDTVTYKGNKYRCVVDNCVWSPDTYPAAWELVS